SAHRDFSLLWGNANLSPLVAADKPKRASSTASPTVASSRHRSRSIFYHDLSSTCRERGGNRSHHLPGGRLCPSGDRKRRQQGCGMVELAGRSGVRAEISSWTKVPPSFAAGRRATSDSYGSATRRRLWNRAESHWHHGILRRWPSGRNCF